MSATLMVSLPLFAAVIACGVMLYINRDTEDCYIEVDLDHDPKGISKAFEIIDAAGLEVMSRHECEPVITETGAHRIYLAERLPHTKAPAPAA